MVKNSIILFILLFLIILASTPAYTYVTLEYSEALNTLIVQTYFTGISIDLRYGGIIKSYKYNYYNIEISNSRYFGPGTIYEALYYEIIPSVTPVTGMSTIIWPGEIFRHKASYQIIEDKPYESLILVKTRISDVYNVYLIKKYRFYYDKPYFDIDYIFINDENIELKMDLSQAWLRATSFSIELASSFGGDAEDDFQICGTIDGNIIVHQDYSPGEIINLQGKVKFIALISHSNDYIIPQGIILIPLDNTIKNTFGVWYEIAGQGLIGVPHSSIIRLEMKAFKLPPKTNISYSFRTYIGPITYQLLSELGLQSIAVTLRTQYIQRIPDYAPEYRVQTNYKLTIELDVISKNLYPNATLNIYYVERNGSLTIVDNISLIESEHVIILSKPGLYKFEINPSTGFTLDGKHIYEKTYVEGKEIDKTYIPVYRDASVTLGFDIVPVAWITILCVDENYYSLNILDKYPVIIEFKSEIGTRRVYNISSPEYRIYLAPGTYVVSIRPSETANRRLTDIYVNNEYILYRVLANETRFTYYFRGGTENTLVLRYVRLGAEGNAIEVFLVIIIGFVTTALLLVFLIIMLLRGRRRL